MDGRHAARRAPFGVQDCGHAPLSRLADCAALIAAFATNHHGLYVLRRSLTIQAPPQAQCAPPSTRPPTATTPSPRCSAPPATHLLQLATRSCSHQPGHQPPASPTPAAAPATLAWGLRQRFPAARLIALISPPPCCAATPGLGLPSPVPTSNTCPRRGQRGRHLVELRAAVVPRAAFPNSPGASAPAASWIATSAPAPWHENCATPSGRWTTPSTCCPSSPEAITAAVGRRPQRDRQRATLQAWAPDLRRLLADIRPWAPPDRRRPPQAPANPPGPACRPPTNSTAAPPACPPPYDTFWLIAEKRP